MPFRAKGQLHHWGRAYYPLYISVWAKLNEDNEIVRHTAERQYAEGWMNLTQAAEFLEINSTTLRIAFERGEIQAEHPFPHGPWIVNRSFLQTEPANRLAARLHGREQTPATSINDQGTLDLSET